ncbi:hypothetical protein GW17_00061082 [Ensete ventricosum]|nr:hypothetical protein GW17_00061082 [Ensete ventricosum]
MLDQPLYSVGDDALTRLVPDLSATSPSEYSRLRSDAVVGLKWELAKKLSSNSLASESKEEIDAGLSRQYHIQAGPLGVLVHIDLEWGVRLKSVWRLGDSASVNSSGLLSFGIRSDRPAEMSCRDGGARQEPFDVPVSIPSWFLSLFERARDPSRVDGRSYVRPYLC